MSGIKDSLWTKLKKIETWESHGNYCANNKDLIFLIESELSTFRERAEKAEKELAEAQEEISEARAVMCWNEAEGPIKDWAAQMTSLYTTAESRIKELEGRLEEAKNTLSGIWIHRCACVVCADNSISLLKEILSSLPDGQTGKEK